VTIHARVLEAAIRLCRGGGGWTFRPRAVVAALSDLNPGSVRTHVMSRCCVNAPSNHAHRWPYFRRVGRGLYQVLPAWRRGPRPGTRGQGATGRRRVTRAREAGVSVSESAAGYSAQLGPDRPDPVVERYMRDIDRTLIRQSLSMTHEERLCVLQDWMNATEEMRGAAAHGRAVGGREAAARRRRRRVS
jgi:hypothetical protein